MTASGRQASPGDAAVAARSFPRRWRALFARAVGDAETDDVLRRPGSTGSSAAELATRATERLAATATGLGRAVPSGGDDELDRLTAAATALAEAIDATESSTWFNDGVLDALTSGIDDAAAALRQAEQVLAEVIGHPR